MQRNKTWCENISKALKGRIISKEQREKMSKSMKGRLAGSKHFNWVESNTQCFICNKVFHRKPSHIKRLGKKFCSYKCRGIHQSQSRRGKNHPYWKGGKHINTQGYVMIKKSEHPFCNKQGYVREHRLVMEKHLKRYLEPIEQIHHINHNKIDNRIENLMLFPTNSSHLKFCRPGSKYKKSK